MNTKSPFVPAGRQLLNWRASIQRLRTTAPAVGVFSVLLLGGTHSIHAANDAWSTTPTNGNFTGINWTTGTTTPGAPTGTVASGDAIYFGTSNITTLNDDEAVGFSLTGITFNAGASAYTIGGNLLILNGGITNSSSALQTINDALLLSGPADTFNTTTGNLTLGGAITGTGLNGTTLASGGGTVTLGGNNSFTTAGGVGNAIQIIGGSTLAITGTTGIAFGGANDYFSDGQGGGGAGTVTVASGGTLNVTGNGRFIVGTFTGGTLNINGTMNVAAASSLQLSYNGQAVVNLNSGGVLASGSAIGNANSANGTTATFNFNGGTLRATAAVANILTLGGIATTVTTSSTGSTVDSNGFAISLNNTITNGATVGGLTIIDSSAAKSGSVALSGTGTYTGVTTITGGTFQLGTGGGTGTLSVNGTIVDNGTLVFNRSNAVAQGTDFGTAAITGTGGLTQAGAGNLTLSAANTYTGVTSANAGTITVTGSLSGSSRLALNGGTFAYAPTAAGSAQTLGGTTINLGNSAVSVTAGNTLALGAITRSGNGLVSFGTGGGAITTSSAGANGILGPYAYTNTGMSLSYVTPGTVAAYTGGTVAATAAGVTSTVGTVNYNVAAGGTVGAGASANTLRYTGAADTVAGPVTLNGLMNAGTGALALGGAVTVGGTSELVVLSNGQNITLGGPVGNNGATASALTYGGPGAGTLTMSGASTYTGVTTVNAGTLQLGNGAAASSLATSGIVVNNNGTTTTGALVFNSTAAQSFAGAISGTGGLTQAGTGATTISGTNTYAGATTISAGTLRLGNGGTTGSLNTGSVLTDNGTLAFNRSNAVAQGTDFSAAVLAGTGGLTQAGSGSLTLSAFNTYTGGTTVNGGNLILTAGGGAGTVRGTVTVNPGATLTLGVNNALGYTAGTQVATLNINGGTVNTTGALGDEGYLTSFNLTGGTLAYAGTDAGDAYQINAADASAPGITSNASATTSMVSGNVQIRGGTLGVTVAKGTTASGVDLQVSGVISGTNFGVTKAGPGMLALSAVNTYTGPTTVNAGTLLVTGSTVAGSAVTVNGAGTTLTGTGTIGGSVSIGNGAILSAGNRTLAVPAAGNLTTGPLTLQTGSTFNAVLTNTGTFSTLNATGTTDLLNAAFSISLTPGATFANNSILQLITSNVIDTFTNTAYTTGGYTFAADYASDPGFFDVDIRAAVPEPTTYGLLAAGMAGMLVASRRRKINAWLRAVRS